MQLLLLLGYFERMFKLIQLFQTTQSIEFVKKNTTCVQQNL
jgi:hypothetical protein